MTGTQQLRQKSSAWFLVMNRLPKKFDSFSLPAFLERPNMTRAFELGAHILCKAHRVGGRYSVSSWNIFRRLSGKAARHLQIASTSQLMH
ncbi:hypothetical protein EVAR_26998_1 [Eumeta japonica]|uniref:Uncharacterized protein n=1 Tax=Eumeta variegata TaxID=151549 RepID=A0A4C1VLC5_EUMVA|nr:hypothetical protein EVAR_26998_1 [Eumeta japonica]